MESEIPQLSRMHDRLRMMLSTHSSALNHETLKPLVGKMVIQKDTRTERLPLIQSGELRFERTEPRGTSQLIATVGANEVIGKMAPMGDRHHSATMTLSRGPAELLAVRADYLMQSATCKSDLVMELIALSSSHCWRTNCFLALILQAMIRKEDSTLERCCNEMKESAYQALPETVGRLRELAQALEQS